jgi:hypothetical protein
VTALLNRLELNSFATGFFITAAGSCLVVAFVALQTR